jgi:hypothetical protein
MTKTVVVVEPPERVVSASDARAAKVFSADDDDDYVNLLLDVAQAEIDGWDGWLGRAIGEQVLEMTMPASCKVDASAFPLPPFISIVSDTVSDDGKTRTVRWNAGYADGEIPAPIRHAIILMAGQLRDVVPSDVGDIKRKTVEGVGTWEYSLPDGAAEAMKSAAKRLLAPYRIYS